MNIEIFEKIKSRQVIYNHRFLKSFSQPM